MAEEDKDLRDYDFKEIEEVVGEELTAEVAEEIEDEDGLDKDKADKAADAKTGNDDNDDEKESYDEVSYDPESDDKSMKYMLVVIGCIILFFAIFFGVRYFYADSPVGEVLTIEDYHKQNLLGKLDPEKGYTSNGFSFVLYDGLWYTQLTRNVKGNNTLFNIPLHYGPKHLKDILIGGDGELGKSGEVYITFDPTQEKLGYVALSAAELSLNLAKGISIVPKIGCTKNETGGCADREIVNCGDKDRDVILLRDADKPAVVFKDNCVIIQGRDANLTRATDRFILFWYGIMPRDA